MISLNLLIFVSTFFALVNGDQNDLNFVQIKCPSSCKSSVKQRECVKDTDQRFKLPYCEHRYGADYCKCVNKYEVTQNINNTSNENVSPKVLRKNANEKCRFSCKWDEKQRECVKDVNNPCRPPVCGHKYGADYCKCIEDIWDIPDANSKNVVRRSVTKLESGNCPTSCKWSDTTQQCQMIHDTKIVSGCEDRDDAYCSCVADKDKLCLAGFCPFEKNPRTGCANWKFWC